MSDENLPSDQEQNSNSGTEVDPAFLSILVGAIGDRDPITLYQALTDCHPADAADALEQLAPDVRQLGFQLLAKTLPSEILIEMKPEYRVIAIEDLPDVTVKRALEELDSDDAADLLDDIAEDRREAVLGHLSTPERDALEAAFSFDEETAGRLMQREFVAAPEFWTVGETVDHARAHSDDLPDTFFEIYVVDPAFRIKGAVGLHDLLKAQRIAKLSEVMRAVEVEIKQEMDQEEVAFLFEKYHLASAPVTDEGGRLIGMITVDDMMEVIQEENREDLLALSGVNQSSSADTVWTSIKARAPWLGVNLFTAFLVSLVISLFEATLDRVVALAILMPVVAALGGNAGAQALAVTVRALAERQLDGAVAARAVRRELLTGLINGIIFALAVSMICLFWFKDIRLAGVIAIAMLGTFIWAGLAGILIPLGLKRMGADPAVSSSIFLLTTVDIIGFLSFLGLASLILL